MRISRKKDILTRSGRLCIILGIAVNAAGCASFPGAQPGVDTMVASRNYERALAALGDKKNTYGKNNRLLYLMDKGYVQHLAGQYEKSIVTFAQAKELFEELYTKSITGIAATWLFNDYSAPYRGEDFERVLINIFQALNYVMLGRFEEALVEARDVDAKLHAINAPYPDGQKNVYKEDAFARFLMGIIYEAGKTRENFNDAFIAYRAAEKIYETDYRENYGLPAPGILKENILSAARFMGFPEFSEYRDKFKGVSFIDLRDKQEKAELYLIQYNGVSPVKVEAALPVPMPDGYILKVAFPQYKPRPYGIHSSRLLAKTASGRVVKADTSAAQPVGAIAEKNLENRKLRFIAKTTARAAARYAIERKQEESIRKRSGFSAAGWFRFFSNIYNIVVEKADVRCWQTLPGEIRICRLILEPGEYEFALENFNENGALLGVNNLGKAALKSGQKKFYIVHTSR